MLCAGGIGRGQFPPSGVCPPRTGMQVTGSGHSMGHMAEHAKQAVNSPCCVCGTSQSTPFHEVSYRGHGYPGVFTLRKCDGCGMLFNSPRLSDHDLSALYDGNYYFFQRNDKDEFRRALATYRRTVALAGNRITPQRVLEIGSAKGYLLALLKQLGWEVQGLELSEDAARYAVEQFGVPTRTGMIETYAGGPDHDSFPLVLAMDVLEHVPDPRRFIDCISTVMPEGGTLIIDTPNGAAANIGTEGPNWNGFNPFHIFLFSADNLRRLLEDCAFDVEQVFSYNNTRKTSFPSRCRHAVWTALERSGMVRTAYALHQYIRRMLSLGWKRDVALAGMAAAARQASVDGITEAGARDCLGDNLVMIARKRTLPPQR